jgi:hypothetical protein
MTTTEIVLLCVILVLLMICMGLAMRILDLERGIRWFLDLNSKEIPAGTVHMLRKLVDNE